MQNGKLSSRQIRYNTGSKSRRKGGDPNIPQYKKRSN